MLWNDYNPTVEEVRAVPCPVCGAVPGAHCVAMGKKVQKLHRAHVDRQYAAFMAQPQEQAS